MAHAIVPACLARSPARAGRPPRAGGPLPAARDGEVILDAPACPARSPYRGDGPPLAGLGLPLATSHREGIPDAAYLGALARVLVPAKGGFVLDLPVPEGGGHVCDLDHLLREACREAPGSRAWHLAAPKVTARQLAAIIPTLDLPAAREFWVFREHFDQAMYRLGRCYIIPGMLPKAPPLPAREPLALTAPTPTGPVLASHFMAFFADHQGPGQHLARALNWGHDRGEPYTDAGAANAAAERLLGVPVDLRAGCLLSALEVRFAIRHAAGKHGSANGAADDRALAQHVGRVVPRVAKAAGRVALPGGEAWSCALDAALNGPATWLRRADARWAVA